MYQKNIFNNKSKELIRWFNWTINSKISQNDNKTVKIQNLNRIEFLSEVTRIDWLKRWLFSTNAKDIFRPGGVFCHIEVTFMCRRIVHTGFSRWYLKFITWSKKLCITKERKHRIYLKNYISNRTIRSYGGLFRLAQFNEAVLRDLNNNCSNKVKIEFVYSVCLYHKYNRITWVNLWNKTSSSATWHSLPLPDGYTTEKLYDVDSFWTICKPILEQEGSNIFRIYKNSDINSGQNTFKRGTSEKGYRLIIYNSILLITISNITKIKIIYNININSNFKQNKKEFRWYKYERNKLNFYISNNSTDKRLLPFKGSQGIKPLSLIFQQKIEINNYLKIKYYKRVNNINIVNYNSQNNRNTLAERPMIRLTNKKKNEEIINVYSPRAIKNDLYCGTSINQFFHKKENNMNQDGGKIGEEAKASSNVDDSGFQSNSLKTLNHIPFGMPNSPLLNLNSKYLRIHVHYTRDMMTETSIYKKNVHTLSWPKEWTGIKERVRKKQMKLADLATTTSIYDPKVLSLQRKLILTLDFRQLAVHTVCTNQGSKTPGIDKKILTNEWEKNQIVGIMKKILHEPNLYKATPVKRVLIPKRNGSFSRKHKGSLEKKKIKMRPLGIPTIQDRCLQSLLNLVLEPVVEITSDTHSFGFRKFRSAKMAIGAVRRNLRSDPTHYDKYVLDADIKSFFDNISHKWLMEKVPLEISLKIILKKWLKAGVININKWEETYAGTPQVSGGIISPTLANFTLNGLEKAIFDGASKVYEVQGQGKHKKLYIKRKNKERRNYPQYGLQLSCIRYADDFLVIARSKRFIIKAVKPAVETFLKERGLYLSVEKTKILSVRASNKINFLGYTFQYQKFFKPKYKLFHDRIGQEGIACYPNKEKFLEIRTKIKKIIMNSLNISAYELITKLNPIIRGWCNYFNLSQSYNARNRLSTYLFRYLMEWAHRKHPRWGKKRIAIFYFLRKPLEAKDINPKADYEFGPKPLKWVFRGRTSRTSIYNDNTRGKLIELLNPTKVIATLSADRYRLPRKLEEVHAFHPKFNEIIEFNQNIQFLAIKETPTLKSKLLVRQKGLCYKCKTTLLTETGELNYDGSLHIHHIEPRGKGGSKWQIKNLALVHSLCHNLIHENTENIK